MSAPKDVIRLVEKFDQNLESYRLPQYNEAQLRNEFLNPLFRALDWDMDNSQGLAEAYKDVIFEDAIRIGGAVKAPDYCFRIGGTRKFFLEAKKPSIDIGKDVSPAYQLRRYAWSAKLPLGILSDFEDFAVHDCRIKPKLTDSAATARIFLCNFREYPDKWDWIYSIFSKGAILKGSFDKFSQEAKGKHGTMGVDDDFLATIERWRSELARNLALRNSHLTQREINFAVQRIIDRIIFLRMCEDRQIEPFERLRALSNGVNVYPRLCEIFEEADAKYNSGLFHFQAEKGAHELPDQITMGLSVDDKLLKSIIRDLYYPESPYVFDAIPPDILGQVYEQFLGKVIRLTDGHRAIVEDKPEVKKAGGVYYTPTYIVDYIVKQTVGKSVEGKTPKQVSGIKILDPACGSGSFLINAYQYLLDWHHQWYLQNDPAKWAKGRSPVLVQTTSGWKLTIAERKRILLDGIYGVDIDSQAVEVTKLSLLLKVLEGESEQTIQPYLRLFQQRALPDLGENIKCGNSLIDTTMLGRFGYESLKETDLARISAFDWNLGFPEIMRDGGFDVIIGNPPYIRIQGMREWAPIEVECFKNEYESASQGNFDIYVVFVEKALKLADKNACLGFILPHKFLNAQYGLGLRTLLSRGNHLKRIVHFGAHQVFRGATTYTCLLFLTNAVSPKFVFSDIENLNAWRDRGESEDFAVPAEKASGPEWNFKKLEKSDLFEKMEGGSRKLGEMAQIFVGTQTSAEDIFVLDNCTEEGSDIVGLSRSLDRVVKIEKSITQPFLRGKDIRRYKRPVSTSRLICPYEINEDKSRLFTREELAQYPLAYQYLMSHKEALSSREKGRFRNGHWYAFGYPKSMHLFQRTKIIMPDFNDEPSYSIDLEGHFFKTGYGILLRKDSGTLEFLLGLLNSSLLFQYLISIGTTLRGGYIRFWTQFTEQLPIWTIDASNKREVEIQNAIINAVSQLANFKERLDETRSPYEKENTLIQVSGLEREIDFLVYGLYRLTPEEIGKIEDSAVLPKYRRESKQ